MAKRGFQGAVMRGFGARVHDAVVTGTEQLAPHFLRVRFSSTTLFDDADPGPTAYLRFWVPDPNDPDTEHQRGYTFSEADTEEGTFAVDFVLHEPAGPASVWAKHAEPGSTISITSFGSKQFTVPDELPAGYLLIGDSASIPAINSIIDVLPRDVAVEVYLEQHDDADLLIPMSDHPLMNTHWVPRLGPTSLAAAIEDRDWSNWKAWAGTESKALKHLRTRLRDDFGFPKSEVYAQAYWFHGRAMGTYRSNGNAEPEPTIEEAPPAPQPTRSSRGSWQAESGSKLIGTLRNTFVAAGALQALITLIQLAPFVLLTELARRMLDGAPESQLWTIGIWAIGLMGAGTLLAAALSFWLHTVDAHFERGLRKQLLSKLAKLPLGWFDDRDSGQVKRVVQDDTLSLHYLVTHAVTDAVAAVVAPVAVLIYLFTVDWRLALLMFVPILVYVVTTVIMVVQSGNKTAQAMRWADRMSSEAGAYLEGQPVIRVFGGAAASTFRARLREYIEFLDGWQRPFSNKKSLIDLATRPATFLLLITVAGTALITSGSMQPTALLPFLFLGTTFGARLLGLGYGLGGLRGGMLAARRIGVVLDEPELGTRESDSAPARHASSVEFDRVCFSYRPGVPVIDDVSLALSTGTITALVGHSGSGKSTMAALLARFHDIDDGTIRIFGRDIREFDADSLYEQVGFVFQDTQLVMGTVRDNIALAVPDATDEQIESAARSAYIHDRILQLPDGYDTVLDADPQLSGGERQRITIARAILADTPILVLDEATAFADPESEYFVQQALGRLTAGRTVLVIAHRLHTIVDVDRIVVLDRGRIAETGTHSELLAADGRYRQMWDAGSHTSNELAYADQEPAR
ncbi:ATP-binding cassette domain-containing protein [Rhodococcus sp. HNM0563]|uniref:ABC transporter ATP-binding protein/permease n=1 Tax=Rhodococcus sp. HNM0563 TaxID=2716339 RepID=UPI00146B8014|nr:ABC transporter ATP-binding protein/permease [Rhodococcus sp. HNM0563]NLU64202.1 ATP-binding cassette domain-containing protein [Rhodococcus sp. HNM0563]